MFWLLYLQGAGRFYDHFLADSWGAMMRNPSSSFGASRASDRGVFPNPTYIQRDRSDLDEIMY